MAGIVSWAVYHPLSAAIVAAVFVILGLVLLILLASRIRRVWRGRRQARLRRKAGKGTMAADPSTQGQNPFLPNAPQPLPPAASEPGRGWVSLPP